MKIKNISNSIAIITDLKVKGRNVVLAPGVEMLVFNEDAEKSRVLESYINAGYIQKISNEEPTDAGPVADFDTTLVARIPDISNDGYLSIDAQDAILKKHEQNKDGYLDQGGANEVSANQVLGAVINSHDGGAQDINLTNHSANSSGIHGVGVGTIAQVLDIADDTKLSTEAQDAIDKKHSKSFLDEGLPNEVSAADAADAVIKKHDGDAQDILIALKLDASKLVAYDSDASTGGNATETMTVTGLAAGDTILAVSQKTEGANSTAIIQWANQAANSLDITWTGDPGLGSVVTVLVKKA